MATVELQLKSGKASLKLIRKDLHQIYNVGNSAVEKSEPDLTPNFLAMYQSAADLRSQYMSEFMKCFNLVIVEEKEVLFPTEDDIKQRNEVNSLFYKIVEFHQVITKGLSDSDQSGKGGATSDMSCLNQSSVTRSRLPKVEIPKFSGEIGEWPKFKQLFVSIIHSKSDIPNIEKFHYLCTSVTQEAKSIIAPFTIDDENYLKAWDALCKRYDNKRLLATSYVDKILDFNPSKGSPTLAALQAFIANVGENIAAFKSINVRDEADFIWLTLALRKLDGETRKQFEIYSIETEWPTFESLIEFIYGRCRALQLSQCSDAARISKFTRTSCKPHVLTTTTPLSSSCSGKQPCQCDSPHPLHQCPIFRKKSPSGRKSFLKGKIICFNCLKLGHISPDCTSTGRCQTCNAKHHTLLHYSKNNKTTTSPEPLPTSTSSRDKVTSADSAASSLCASVTGPTQVVLGTIEAFILDSQKRPQPVRFLLDCGSQFSLITSECAKRLGLPWRSSKHRPVGAGETPLPKIKGTLSCQIQSRIYPDQIFDVNPLVVSTITGALPNSLLKPIQPTWLVDKTLADPTFWRPKSIDFLLGGDLFMQIVTGPPTTVDANYEALPTVFGLIIMGNTAFSKQPSNLSCFCITDASINDILLKFWETEEVTTESTKLDLDPCEAHFRKTHFRDDSGRYVVALPFKVPPNEFEGSKSLALSQYMSLERKMSKNRDFKENYQAFLQEYVDLGHMSPTSKQSKYVIPHHGVFKSQDPNSKIRVVFNASAPTSQGSLNDLLYVGPKLQQDITNIILNFRRHPIAITADLVKMYRQILVRPEDRCYQHILWRPNPSADIMVFELNTVTYGVASSPFHALRTVKQLVHDEGEPYPLASKVLTHDIYVDDIVSGVETLQEANQLRGELVNLLGKASFEIHKWASNSNEFLQSLTSNNNSSSLSFLPKDSCTTKVLGMLWDPINDNFYYQLGSITRAVTKRSILSVIARLFDPMGYLAPVIFKGKTILQGLWSSRLSWDEEPEHHIVHEWLEYSGELAQLQDLRIPRYILSSSIQSLQLLGFCDASQKGFAAALYIRVISNSGQVKVSLLKAKTRLAPLKTISIPRLELAAAHLLVNLVLSVEPLTRSLVFQKILLFTDSTIVLSWLKISPHLLQTFVANRISFIINHSNISQWHHISSYDNPADVASRGLSPSLLQHHALWWTGPHWLQDVEWSPSSTFHLTQDVPELKPGIALVTRAEEPYFISWMSRFSHYKKMIRVMAYVSRFIHNSRFSDRSLVGPLSAEEYTSALDTCIKITQSFEFKGEFSWINNRPVSKRLQVLAAYVDAKGVIRVGGRLQNSELSEKTKFPVILPGSSHLIKLMISYLHETHYHLGYQALQALLRRQFWIFRLRQAIKSQLRKCLTCFKMNSRPQVPFMGNLPSCRVTPARPFSHCGIDFAGPFMIKLSTRRNAPTTKSYLSIFVCMATRAAHLELVSSLSTNAFLAALDRFIARRGCPAAIYSDCGTNFVGANRHLRDLYKWMHQRQTQCDLHDHTVSKGIKWHFNPPHAPNFGGLWEAAVKSAKRHLYRVTKERSFTYEELTTLFTRIEAILNSRPLCPMQDDTSQGDVLTPGHFLIGAPLLGPPEQDHLGIPSNKLSRWQLISKSIQHFWKRWHSEYLSTLQKRPKWYHSSKPLQIGELVMIPDSRSSPLHWKLARISDIHPGEDGIIRVVTLKDNTSVFKRPVSKLVSLSHLREPHMA